MPTTVLTTPPRLHTGAPNSDNPCDTTKQLQTIHGSSLGTDPLTATCQHMQVDTYELLQPTAKQPDTPRATFQTPKKNASFPRAKITPHTPFATRITRYNIILGKRMVLKLSVPLDTARMLRLPPQKETTPLRLEISAEQSHPVQDDPS